MSTDALSTGHRTPLADDTVVLVRSAVAVDVRIRIAPLGAIDPMVRELPS